MHLLMILMIVGVGSGLRFLQPPAPTRWVQRWQQALTRLMIPPLLLLTTATAILWMGPEGQMFGQTTGWIGYGLAWGFWGWAGITGMVLAVKGWQTTRQVRRYAPVNWQGLTARLLESPVPFCAQIGFWQPELVVSQGLLEQLDPAQQQAVCVHEQAHVHYRDTFWFFWLGWCRRLSFGLPDTELLWQELLLLRELRADQRAAQQVDPLVLAETLLLMVRSPLDTPEHYWAGFSCLAPSHRLTERIDAILAHSLDQSTVWVDDSARLKNIWIWTGYLLVLLPLMAIPFHS
ncbi:MAG: M56 family metallopeptidase [Oscillatoriales cyanobacterium RM2_1_1]|nr:M56 family metallopeptidase [Oscillatoriales cyanobacterium SM2_3_0]NJO47787.1 M56 family metallopeptidase [Oscillatoriales cyanobacterium RM2_1_1]